MLLRSLCDLFFLFRWTLYLRKPPPLLLPIVREKDKIKRTERSRASGYEITYTRSILQIQVTDFLLSFVNCKMGEMRVEFEFSLHPRDGEVG